MTWINCPKSKTNVWDWLTGLNLTVYYLVFYQWLNIPLEKCTYWPSGLLVSKQFFQVEYSVIGQMLKITCTDFGGNNRAKFIYYQILPDTLMTKLK